MERQSTASTCCYCGVGCGVLIEHDGRHILGVSGDPTHPANFGKLCSKGASLHLTGDHAARALYPELRLGKALARNRCDWDSALEHAAGVFAQAIAEHGPDSVAFYISGQLLTEDYYAFNKLARGPGGHQQHRQQFPAVHVFGGGGLQAQPGGRRAAVQL